MSDLEIFYQKYLPKTFIDIDTGKVKPIWEDQELSE